MVHTHAHARTTCTVARAREMTRSISPTQAASGRPPTDLGSPGRGRDLTPGRRGHPRLAGPLIGSRVTLKPRTAPLPVKPRLNLTFTASGGRAGAAPSAPEGCPVLGPCMGPCARPAMHTGNLLDWGLGTLDFVLSASGACGALQVGKLERVSPSAISSSRVPSR